MVTARVRRGRPRYQSRRPAGHDHVVQFEGVDGWVTIKGPWPRLACERYVDDQQRMWRGTDQANRYRIRPFLSEDER